MCASIPLELKNTKQFSSVEWYYAQIYFHTIIVYFQKITPSLSRRWGSICPARTLWKGGLGRGAWAWFCSLSRSSLTYSANSSNVGKLDSPSYQLVIYPLLSLMGLIFHVRLQKVEWRGLAAEKCRCSVYWHTVVSLPLAIESCFEWLRHVWG